jgi:two-component system C4-dicarboxylate transport response regulator DctD
MSVDLVNGPVILVEDDRTLREATVQTLELSGLDVQPFESAARAALHVVPSFAGCIVTDIRMDGMDGLQLFGKVMEIDRQIPVILITGHGDVGMAVRAMHDGAFDFLAKPFAADHLAAVVRKALQSRQLVIDNRALRSALARPDDDMVAQSRAMAQLRNMTGQVARTELDVSIEGETGTGKEMLARRIHQQSVRHAQPFVVVPCATLTPDTALDQFVGQVGGGTLFLDGCDTLIPQIQARLVAVLDSRDRGRAANDARSDFRVVASTPVALPEMLARGSLGEELFHRLSSITLRIPPLRERREDIPALFAQFVRDALAQTGKKRFEMNAADRKRLLEHDWPGNARELRNYVFGAVLNLPRQSLLPQSAPGSKVLATRVSAFERMVITETLEATSGNVVRACALLDTPRKTFYEKLAKHHINPTRFRPTQTPR